MEGSSGVRFVACLAVGLAVPLVLFRRRKKSKFREVPGGLPLIGHAHLIGSTSRIVDRLDEWAEKYGTCEFRVLGKKFLCLAEVDDVRSLSKHRPRRVQRLRAMREAMDPLFAGLFTAELPNWTVERRLVTPAFSHANLGTFLPLLEGVCERLVAAAARCSRDVDVTELSARFATDVISSVGFGQDFKSLDQFGTTETITKIAGLFDEALAVVGRRATAVLPLFKIPFFGPWLDGGSSLKRKLDAFGNDLLSKADPINGNTVLDKMVEANAKEKVDAQRLVGNVLILHIAGSDTTAHTMAWMLYELAKDPILRNDATEEVTSSSSNEATTFQGALDKLPLLRSLFWETLRLRGPVGITGLENSDTIDLAGQTIEPYEYAITVPFRYILRGKDATFDARRWLDDNGTGLKKTDVMIPFGFGVRICPARDLAELEACQGVASLLRAYPDMTLADPDDARDPPKIAFNFTMKNERPIRLRLY